MRDMRFNGTWASSFGIVVRSKSVPVLPALREKKITVPGRNGAYDFSDGTLDDRIIEVDCALIAPDFRTTIKAVAQWLSGWGTITFDDEPDLAYYGRISNLIPVEQLMAYGSFTLTFRVRPHAILTTEVSTINDLVEDITLYRDLRFNDKYSFNVLSAQTVQVNNFGTAAVRPLLAISGTFSTLSIGTGLKTTGYAATNGGRTLYLDCERFLATLDDGSNVLQYVTGDFIELAAGVNTVTISGTGLNCTVKFQFQPRFL